MFLVGVSAERIKKHLCGGVVTAGRKASGENYTFKRVVTILRKVDNKGSIFRELRDSRGGASQGRGQSSGEWIIGG